MKKEDYKLYISLILWTLLPSIYLLIRIQLVATTNTDINILGQMEWFDLIDEIITTSLIVPLYSILKKYKNSILQAFTISILLYSVFTIGISTHISTLTKFMNAEHATSYFLLQSISMLIGFLTTFMILIFTLNDESKTINKLIILRLLLLIFFDFILIHKFKDIGSVYSEIIVNICIAITSIYICYKKHYFEKNNNSDSKTFVKEWMKIGSFVGLQIFLDNFIYAIMVCKIVNEVNQSGNYWIANNFIWGWLLVPITTFTEIIKKNKLEKLNKENTWKYIIYILCIWLISVPFWKIFISGPMTSDDSAIYPILKNLVPFYIFYSISACIDAWFISNGKTYYNAINSVIVNVLYYGIVYILYKQEIMIPNMNIIINMFGIGMFVHMIVSIIMYKIETAHNNNE